MRHLRFLVVLAAASGIAWLVSTKFNFSPAELPVAAHVDSNWQVGQLDTVAMKELEKRLSEIDLLRSEVAELSKQVAQLQNQEPQQSVGRQEESPIDDNYSNEEDDYSIAYRFEHGDESSQDASFDKSNLEGAIYGSASPDVEVSSAECRGSLCKVYASVTGAEDDEISSGERFIENITNSLTGNVNIYFDEESGQQIIYVESVE